MEWCGGVRVGVNQIGALDRTAGHLGRSNAEGGSGAGSLGAGRVRVGATEDAERGFALTRGQLLKDAAHDYAAPGVRLPALVYLKGDARIGAQGIEFLAGDRVAIDESVAVGKGSRAPALR